MKDNEPIDTLKNFAGLSIGVSILLIVLGFLAIVMPMATGIAVSIIFGWIIVVSGIMHIGYAFTASGAGSFLWRLLIGLLYIAGGIYLLFNAPLTLGSLTLAVAVVFIMEGIFEFFAFFQVRELPGSGGLIFDGILSVVLGVLIAANWPNSSAWAIGTLVGVNLLSSGFTQLFISVGAKKAISAAAH